MKIGQSIGCSTRSGIWLSVSSTVSSASDALPCAAHGTRLASFCSLYEPSRAFTCPGIERAARVMDDPVSQGIKACSEPGLFASSMSFFPNGAASHNAGCAAIGPCDGEGDEYEQGREFVRFGNAPRPGAAAVPQDGFEPIPAVHRSVKMLRSQPAYLPFAARAQSTKILTHTSRDKTPIRCNRSNGSFAQLRACSSKKDALQ